MSEFSEALYLRASSSDEGVALLRAAKVAGYVYPALNGWVPVVYAKGRAMGRDDGIGPILAANRGELVHYAYAEDHGCWVDVYERDVRVARLKASFEAQNARFDRAEMLARALLSAKDADRIEAWVGGAHRWAERQEHDEHVVAKALGLPRYAWFSREYEITNDTPDAGRIEVDAEGRIRERAESFDAELEELLATLPPTRKPPAARPPPAKKATAKKAPTKKSPAKEAPAKKAPAKKKR